jgi:branched-chain amino acid transport system permease protein
MVGDPAGQRRSRARLIGLIETMWSAYFSVQYKDVAAFSILAIVLIFMPTGILGRPEVEKV